MMRLGLVGGTQSGAAHAVWPLQRRLSRRRNDKRDIFLGIRGAYPHGIEPAFQGFRNSEGDLRLPSLGIRLPVQQTDGAVPFRRGPEVFDRVAKMSLDRPQRCIHAAGVKRTGDVGHFIGVDAVVGKPLGEIPLPQVGQESPDAGRAAPADPRPWLRSRWRRGIQAFP